MIWYIVCWGMFGPSKMIGGGARINSISYSAKVCISVQLTLTPPISMLNILVKGEQFSSKTTLNRGEGKKGDLRKEQKERKLPQVQNVLSKILEKVSEPIK